MENTSIIDVCVLVEDLVPGDVLVGLVVVLVVDLDGDGNVDLVGDH
jgi:hypothetical protein